MATTICAVDTFKYRTMQIWNAFISSFSNLIGHETNLSVSLSPADSSREHTPVVSQSSTEERERPGGGCDHQVSVLSCVSSVKSLKYIEMRVSSEGTMPQCLSQSVNPCVTLWVCCNERVAWRPFPTTVHGNWTWGQTGRVLREVP